MMRNFQIARDERPIAVGSVAARIVERLAPRPCGFVVTKAPIGASHVDLGGDHQRQTAQPYERSD
jgi:hypothetical protein